MKGPNISFEEDSKVSISENLSDKQEALESFRVCWWNGGGAIRTRIRVNPGLDSLLKTNPDIFVYGESACSNARGLFLSGYRFLFHRSYIKDKQNSRRGLVFFTKKNITILSLRRIVAKNLILFGQS